MVFYEPDLPTYGMFLIFVLGGVMLGGASLLAARPEAFLTFQLPIGLLTAIRLASVGGEKHLMMAFLAIVFTAATIATTWRFHRTMAMPKPSIASWSCASVTGLPCSSKRIGARTNSWQHSRTSSGTHSHPYGLRSRR
jgi:hypothetical protein